MSALGSIEVGERFRQFVFQRVEDPLVELWACTEPYRLVVNEVQGVFSPNGQELFAGTVLIKFAGVVKKCAGSVARPSSGQGLRGRSKLGRRGRRGGDVSSPRSDPWR
jgi:hypothetical protein